MMPSFLDKDASISLWASKFIATFLKSKIQNFAPVIFELIIGIVSGNS